MMLGQVILWLLTSPREPHLNVTSFIQRTVQDCKQSLRGHETRNRIMQCSLSHAWGIQRHLVADVWPILRRILAVPP